MLVPQVSTEVLMIARSIAARGGRNDVINAILKEHPNLDFDDAYAATQRLIAFSRALAHTDAFDSWIAPPSPGEIYSDISPALWEVVASARLERDDEDIYALLRFDIADLQKRLKSTSDHKRRCN